MQRDPRAFLWEVREAAQAVGRIETIAAGTPRRTFVNDPEK